MLNPDDRQLYIRALRPPQDYVLDRAIATTFTLNLLTLLSVPLSFSRFELREKDNILDNHVSILEALRRSAGKFHVFCQNGAIIAPPSPNPLFHYLEEMIVEVVPRNPEGIFHPKIWLLRFVGEKGNKVFYRFLCLSRNLTFDRSWDTILTLEGEVRGRYFARNRPLADFIRLLPKLAKKSVRKSTLQFVSDMAEEVRHADFKPPEHFHEFSFHPLGVPGYTDFPIRKDKSRIMVISPFITDGLLQQVAKKSTRNILISRSEELDTLKPETHAMFKEYVLDEVAGEEEVTSIELSSDAAKTSKLDEESHLSGLHAKMYVADAGWNSHIWTGSANATYSAFNQVNVEFLVELVGKKSRVGIDKFLEKKDGVTNFCDLLQEYTFSDGPGGKEDTEKAIERKLAKICIQIAALDIRGKVEASAQKGVYDLVVWVPRLKNMEMSDIETQVWPISLKSSLSQKIDMMKPPPVLTFPGLTADKITSFIAFKLSLGNVSKSFVLNVPLRGIPTNRHEKVFQSIISDREKFLRYLWLLLYEGDYAFHSANLEAKLKGAFGGKGYGSFGEEMPLFEELVRAYSRDPDKIKRIARLIEDVIKADTEEKILPEEFRLLWETFKEARLG